MQQRQIKPEQTLMVGDSIHDLQMAQRANIHAIGVSCGAHSQTLLQQYHPLYCLNQTVELMILVQQKFKQG